MNIAGPAQPTYYIGRISVNASNAMLKEVADYLANYEYSMATVPPASFFHAVKEDIGCICKRHPRCKPVELQYTPSPFGAIIYACKSGSDTDIISISLLEALRQITL